MKEKELVQRERLLEQIEGYFGQMDNLYKLSTNELITIFSGIQAMRNNTTKVIISIRNEIRENNS